MSCEPTASEALARGLLGRRVTVQIDRPLGSSHPVYGFRYPVNYGSVPGLRAPDGEDLDAYVLGVTMALEVFAGRCIAIVHRLDDDDDKVVVVPDDTIMSDAEIAAQTRFQEQFFETVILRD
jgi:inorganic pyrophosphatase